MHGSSSENCVAAAWNDANSMNYFSYTSMNTVSDGVTDNKPCGYNFYLEYSSSGSNLSGIFTILTNASSKLIEALSIIMLISLMSIA